MFRGVFDTTIDIKGRTSIPAKFREVLVEAFGDERFVLTNSNPVRLADGVSCWGLDLYPLNEWSEVVEKLRTGKGLGFTATELAAIKRWKIAPAVECSADKLGRMLVPPHLRKSAALEREIIFVGELNKAEIWSLGEWEKVRRQDVQNYPTDSQALAELGL